MMQKSITLPPPADLQVALSGLMTCAPAFLNQSLASSFNCSGVMLKSPASIHGPPYLLAKAAAWSKSPLFLIDIPSECQR